VGVDHYRLAALSSDRRCANRRKGPNVTVRDREILHDLRIEVRAHCFVLLMRLVPKGSGSGSHPSSLNTTDSGDHATG